MTTNPLSTNRFGLTGQVLGLAGVPAPVQPDGQLVEWVIDCPPCELVTSGFDDRAEARYLADVHNDLHHGSATEALVVAVSGSVLPGQPGGAL